jgi:hypothetical protein
MRQGLKAMDHLHGVGSGNIIQCADGYFAGGRGGGWVYDNQGKKIKHLPGDGGAGHQANFIDAVRRRDPGILHADILQGHISATLCHMANTSYRIGQQASMREINAACGSYEDVGELISRFKSHLQANKIDIASKDLVLGPWLELEEHSETYTGEHAEAANPFISRKYRSPFIVPTYV